LAKSFVDDGMLLPLVIQFKLHVAMIYICTRGQIPDYITPIVTIFAEHQKTVKTDPQKAQIIGYKLLWFLKNTLNQKMFPTGKIDKKTFKNVIP